MPKENIVIKIKRRQANKMKDMFNRDQDCYWKVLDSLLKNYGEKNDNENGE